MLSYLTLHIVETPGAYTALQQLSYVAVVFLLAPFSSSWHLTVPIRPYGSADPEFVLRSVLIRLLVPFAAANLKSSTATNGHGS
jgi:hypothetical protein